MLKSWSIIYLVFVILISVANSFRINFGGGVGFTTSLFRPWYGGSNMGYRPYPYVPQYPGYGGNGYYGYGYGPFSWFG